MHGWLAAPGPVGNARHRATSFVWPSDMAAWTDRSTTDSEQPPDKGRSWFDRTGWTLADVLRTVFIGGAAVLALIWLIFCGISDEDRGSPTDLDDAGTAADITTTTSPSEPPTTTTTMSPTTSFPRIQPPPDWTTVPFSDQFPISPIPSPPAGRYHPNQYGCHSDGRCLDDWGVWCDDGEWVEADGEEMCLETAEGL